MESKLREVAREFLGRADALCFVGYEAAPLSGTRPLVIRDPLEAGKLVWNRQCHANLAACLPRLRGQGGIVGIAVKGCDARALRELCRARQIEREKLFVVGLPCTGLAGPGGEPLALRCHDCRYPDGFVYNVVLGPMETPNLPEAPCADELAGLSAKERRGFWEAELAKCIRCDACRKICYACFCPQCIFESLRPRWISRRAELADKLFFHAVRALHLAGRCIGCGECERACPASLRLSVLSRSVQAGVKELFAFPGAGLTGEELPLLAFSRDDRDPVADKR